MLDQQEFLERLRATFKVEADERIATLTNGLVALEHAADPASQAATLETVYREAHSLKGAARAVQRRDVEQVCQALESVLSALKQHAMPPSPELFDACQRAMDVIVRLLDAREEKPSAAIDALVKQLTACVPQVRQAEKSEVRVAPAAPPAAPDPRASHKSMPTTTIRVAATRVDAILRQAEELLTAKRATEDRAATVTELAHVLESWQKEWRRVQPELQRVQQTVEHEMRAAEQHAAAAPLDKLVEFLTWNQSFVQAIQTRLGTLARAVRQDQRELGTMVDRLLEDTKQVLMLPFTALTDFMPKMVRDIAREQAKDIELILADTGIEIDKRILEQLKTPLLHILRNCVDHGIETPAERQRAGKPARGTITLQVSQASGGKVQVVVMDDGRGIDGARVTRAAIDAGALTATDAATLSANQALDLIFASGVSTSPAVTELSGRGLGMAVVCEGIEAVGGTIAVASVPGQGTTF
ncbi:MAG: Hpt domain-containing protein, partial [bacterium]|nr:Hpt domain-containing protein [bacterium]